MNKYERKLVKARAQVAQHKAIEREMAELGCATETVDEKINRVVIKPGAKVVGFGGKILGNVAKATSKAVGTVGSSLLYAADKDHRRVVDAERLISLAQKLGVTIVVQEEASVSE